MENFEVKPYQFDRNDQVLNLLHRVFKPWGGGEEYFTWKYEDYVLDDCPFPRGWIIEIEGKIVAFNGYLPRKIKVGNTFIWALQSFDTVTDPKFRGQGLFGELQRLIYHEVEKSNIPWVYGWTSEIGFKVFTKKVGWTIWGKQRYLMRVLDSEWFLLQKIQNKILAKIGSGGMDLYFRPASLPSDWQGYVREEQMFPPEVTALCEKWAEKFDIIALRSREYLNWRIANPLTHQHLLCAYQNDSLVGYLVYCFSDTGELDIFDCIWSYESAVLALLVEIEKIAHQSKSKVIRFRVSEDQAASKIFKKSGYFLSRTEFPMLGHCVDCDAPLKELLWQENKSVYWSYFDKNE